MTTTKTATARSGYAHVQPLYCLCGAQWHGMYALRDRNPVIAAHEGRDGCGFITEERYQKLFRVKKYASHARLKRRTA